MSLLSSVSILAFTILSIGMGVYLVVKMVGLLAIPLKIAIGNKNKK